LVRNNYNEEQEINQIQADESQDKSFVDNLNNELQEKYKK